MTPTLVFKIKTIPDTEGLQTLYDLPRATSAADIANIALHKCRQQNGSEFLPHHQQRVVTIACALREADHLKIWSLGKVGVSEGQLIQLFFDDIANYTPNIVSWNGTSVDLPVLHYRGLIHGVQATRYWDSRREFKGEHHVSPHLDLMELMATHQAHASAPLDEMAQFCGFPGKLGREGNNVWDAYKNGGIETIRNYCEIDVANTHLLFLRFQLMRGILSKQAYDKEISLVRETLASHEAAHWQEFLLQWLNMPSSF